MPGRRGSIPRCATNINIKDMEAFTLIRMKEALDRIRKSSGYKVCNKVCALRERHAILYDLTEEQFTKVKHISLERNILEGSCRMIDRNKIPE